MSETKIIRPNKGGQEYFVRTNVDVAIYGGILAGGKLTPLNTKVLTPRGWVRNGDLKVGDEIFTPFNGVQKVAQLFPQGVKKIYKMYLLDGRVAESGEEHLWTFRTDKQRYKYVNSDRSDKTRWTFTETTSQLIERLKRGERLYLPTNDPIEFERKDLPIDPYVLGLLIGDGCMTNSQWTDNRKCLLISNNENDVVKRFASRLKSTRIVEYKKSYTKAVYCDDALDVHKYLKDVGLCTYSYNKFIPHEYLFSSIEQRKELLAGLFDTDGCVDDGSFRFTTTSERLRDDVLHLARSLGYNATWTKDKRTYKYTSGVCYDVVIQTSDEIFHSKKHKERYAEYLTRKGKNFRRANCHNRIVKIEYDRMEEAQCLYINDRDHLYIIDDFVVTHNTFGSILSVAEPCLDPLFRATFFRRTFGQLKQAGGIVDDMKAAYGKEVNVTISESPRATFSSGAYVEMQQINDENPKKVVEKFKGLQADAIYFDELTGFEWFTFTYLMSRCRGKGKWTGKIRATTNPSRRHWLRTFLDWYIRPDGTVDPEKSCMVRYFYIYGDKVNEVAWGDTKEEVYEKAKVAIDRKIASFKGKVNYKQLIKSFTFILGNLTENTALTEGNEGYVGSVAATGGKMSQALAEGNWNVDVDSDEEAPISDANANAVAVTDPQMNNDRWITSDLADTGTDNFLALAWNGFHLMDILILTKSTPRQNAEALQIFAQKHNVADNHIIYDAIRGTYINDYIEDAIPFVSYRAPMGLYARLAYNLKAECYLRLVKMINDHRLSIADEVAQSRYVHAKLNQNIMVITEFVEECSVVRFKDMPSGKKQLLAKKEMNAMLGKGRSMDLLDPIAMRMLPVLDLPYGDELSGTVRDDDEDEVDEDENIYNDSFWA